MYSDRIDSSKKEFHTFTVATSIFITFISYIVVLIYFTLDWIFFKSTETVDVYGPLIMARSIYTLAGVVTSPGNILAVAAILATLYVAVGISTGISPKSGTPLFEYWKISKIHEGVSSSSKYLSVYTIICIFLWFFQQTPTIRQSSDLILYIFSYFALSLISQFPPIDRIQVSNKLFEAIKRQARLSSILVENLPPLFTYLSISDNKKFSHSILYRIGKMVRNSPILYIFPFLSCLPPIISTMLVLINCKEISENNSSFSISGFINLILASFSVILVHHFLVSELAYSHRILKRPDEHSPKKFPPFVTFSLYSLIFLAGETVSLLAFSYISIYLNADDPSKNHILDIISLMMIFSFIFPTISARTTKTLYKRNINYIKSPDRGLTLYVVQVSEKIVSNQKLVNTLSSQLSSLPTNEKSKHPETEERYTSKNPKIISLN